jgi:hypothetical protein
LGREEGGQLLCVRACMGFLGHCLLRPELATRVPGAFPRRCSLCVHGLVCAWVCASCACVHARVPVSWYILLCGAEYVCVDRMCRVTCVSCDACTCMPRGRVCYVDVCVLLPVCTLWMCVSCGHVGCLDLSVAW